MTGALDPFAPLGADGPRVTRAQTPAEDGWRPVLPVPDDAQKLSPKSVQPFAPAGYSYTAHWTYRDADGRVLGYAVRFDRPANGAPARKQFRTLVWCEGPNQQCAWRSKGFPEPRPLYGLDRLEARPDAPVIVCEGEKSAGTAAALFPERVAVTSPNGAQSARRADWMPLRGRAVVVWPDADEPGAKYAADVAELAHEAGAASVAMVTLRPGLPEGWDLADPVPDGLDPARLVAEAAPSAALIARDAAGWPEPKPLPSGLLPVMAFDPDMIPQALGPWVVDIAERMQCAPDFVAVSAMVSLAAVLGRRVAVRPQSKTDWTEVPNLWGCVVGRPGALKSPAMSEAMKPLNRLEAAAREANADALKRHGHALEAFKITLDAAQKGARAAAKEGRPIGGILDLDPPDKPPAKRYVTNDTTYEALGEILAGNPNGVLAFRDELVSLLKGLDREENAAARGFFLTAWNGTSGYTFDRITRGIVHIDAACVSLLGSTQPGRLADYIGRAVKGGAADDGLIQRFSLLVWPDASGAWREVDRYPDSEARQRAWEAFDRLDGLAPADVGAEQSEFDKLPFLRLDDGARDTFGGWRADLEPRLRAGTLHPALESHLSKYRKLVPSLALLNHLTDGGVGPIAETAMLRALGFAEHLESHARRAYGSGPETERGTARAILDRLRKGEIQGEFSARDVVRRHWSNLSDKDQVAAGLDMLDDLDCVKSRRLDTGGRPKVLFTVNPRALA